jgi:hypothetical protein
MIEQRWEECYGLGYLLLLSTLQSLSPLIYEHVGIKSPIPFCFHESHVCISRTTFHFSAIVHVAYRCVVLHFISSRPRS